MNTIAQILVAVLSFLLGIAIFLKANVFILFLVLVLAPMIVAGSRRRYAEKKRVQDAEKQQKRPSQLPVKTQQHP